jgi:hypothetical protein
MTTLYLIVRGEAYEGHHYEGIYSSEENARNKVLELIQSYNGFDVPWAESSHNNWEQGCSYISIESWPVEQVPMGTVWVILRGMAYEGDDCRGIYSDYASARANIGRVMSECVGGHNPWVERDNTWIRDSETITIESWVIDDEPVLVKNALD